MLKGNSQEISPNPIHCCKMSDFWWKSVPGEILLQLQNTSWNRRKTWYVSIAIRIYALKYFLIRLKQFILIASEYHSRSTVFNVLNAKIIISWGNCGGEWSSNCSPLFMSSSNWVPKILSSVSPLAMKVSPHP